MISLQSAGCLEGWILPRRPSRRFLQPGTRSQLTLLNAIAQFASEEHHEYRLGTLAALETLTESPWALPRFYYLSSIGRMESLYSYSL